MKHRNGPRRTRGCLPPGGILFRSRLTLAFALLLVCPPGAAYAQAPRTAPERPGPTRPRGPVTVEAGRPVEGRLAEGECHPYQVALRSGQFLNVEIEQRGVNVAAALYGPAGDQLVKANNLTGTQGAEVLSLLSEASGEYRLEVCALEKGAAGRYVMTVRELRDALPQDASRAAARKVYSEANLLVAEGSAESLKKALAKFNEALPLWRSAGDLAGESDTLNDTGFVYHQLGDRQKALDYYGRALRLTETLGDGRRRAVALNNIALEYDAAGDKYKALDYYRQSLALSREAHYRQGEANSLNNIGLVYSFVGESQKALDNYNQALPVWREINARRGEAITLQNIGYAYYTLGDGRRALDFYAEALPVFVLLGDVRTQAVTLNNMGLAHYLAGEYRQALEHYGRALPLRRAVGDRRGEGNTLKNVGMAYAALGRGPEALEQYGKALDILRAVGDRRGEALTLGGMGDVYASSGDNEKALDYYGQALELSRAVNDLNGEAAARHKLARVRLARGELDEAEAQSEAAVRVVESLRTRIAIQDLRTSYFASVHQYYESYVEVLMRLDRLRPGEGFDVRALQASERARARSLLEMLEEARADVRRGADPALLDEDRTLSELINANAARQLRLLSAPHSEAQAAALRKEADELLTRHQAVEARLRASSPGYSALVSAEPLGLEEIQRLLGPDTMLLEYALGDEHSYLWAVTATSAASYELPGRGRIEPLARSVYQLLNAPNEAGAGEHGRRLPLAEGGRYREEAAALSRMLLGPVAEAVGGKRLLVVADGALQYIPFAALPNPRAGGADALPLNADCEVVSLPSVSTLAALRREAAGRERAPKAVAVLADPVFTRDDPRVARAGVGLHGARRPPGPRGGVKFPRLPYTRQEAGAITPFVPAGDMKRALDFEASRETAISPELGRYRIVHFATHGLVDSENPHLSSLVLSLVDRGGRPVDGFLRLQDVYGMRLGADLVVLSACQTGLGKEIKGEGLLGLTRGFMYAGAPLVLASLWEVNDRAAVELMGRFYEGMFGEKHLGPVAALREAQEAVRKQKRWQEPYYWAGFVIQGDWMTSKDPAALTRLGAKPR